MATWKRFAKMAFTMLAAFTLASFLLLVWVGKDKQDS
jgi:hypothetical protein